LPERSTDLTKVSSYSATNMPRRRAHASLGPRSFRDDLFGRRFQRTPRVNKGGSSSSFPFSFRKSCLSGGVFFFLRERMISPSYVQPTEGAGMDPQQSPACTGPAVPSFPHVGPSSDENVRVESWKNEPRRKKNGLVVVSRPTAADSSRQRRE
jgi:hypothetical protein